MLEIGIQNLKILVYIAAKKILTVLFNKNMQVLIYGVNGMGKQKL
jgi:hypothetical protein